MLGKRQSLQAQRVTLSGGDDDLTFTVDSGEHLIKRIKIGEHTGDIAGTATVMIQAEGEWLYSGQAVRVSSLFRPSDQVTARTTAATGPWVLEFDLPLTLSRDYPVQVRINGNASDVAEVILEGVGQ